VVAARVQVRCRGCDCTGHTRISPCQGERMRILRTQPAWELKSGAGWELKSGFWGSTAGCCRMVLWGGTGDASIVIRYDQLPFARPQCKFRVRILQDDCFLSILQLLTRVQQGSWPDITITTAIKYPWCGWFGSK
jgi:hypothetical protein